MRPNLKWCPLFAFLGPLIGGCSTASEPSGRGGMGGSSGGSAAAMGGSTASGGVSLGGAPAELSGPIQRGDLLVLAFGERELAVDPSHGGRIVSLRFADQELLVQEGEAPQFGSTLWTSPQSTWGWPPPTALDSEPYQVTLAKDSFALRSETSSELSEPISMQKTFSVDFAKEVFVVRYTIKNEGTAPITLAAWEVTRVRPGGMSFFPTGGKEEKAPTLPLLPLAHESGISFFDHAAWLSGEGQKVNADGKEGFLAHVAGDVLFVKSFSDVPLADQHADEGEIEIYADGSGTYVELENQSAMTDLGAGKSLVYEVRFHLASIPSTIDVSGGSSALVEFARDLAE